MVHVTNTYGYTVNWLFCGVVRFGEALSYILLFFFFFQAEDGIRDLIVTGVQTCALPISGQGTHRTCPRVWWSSRDSVVVCCAMRRTLGTPLLRKRSFVSRRSPRSLGRDRKSVV